MAEVFVSAGVYTQETDESFVPAGAGGAVGAALVGLTQKGPAFLPVEIGNFSEFRQIFGNMKATMHVPYAARSYLRNATTLNVVRVLGRGTATVGQALTLAFPHGATGVSGDNSVLSAGNTVLGILRFRGSSEAAFMSGSPTDFAIAIPGKSVTAGGLSFTQSSASYIRKVLGSDPQNVRSGDALTAVYIDSIFDYKVGGSVTGSVSGATGNSMFASCCATDSSQVTGGYAPSETPMIVSQNFGGVVYDLFRVFTRSDGSETCKDVKISITQVNLDLTANPQFSVLVRTAEDTDSDPQVLEQFSDLTLDPSEKNYIARAIGDRYPVYDLTQDPPSIVFDGDYDNRSNYIRVKMETGYPTQARPSGFKGVSKINPVPYIPEIPIVTTHLNARSEVDNNVFLGMNTGAGSGGVFDRLKTTTTSASAGTSADSGVLFMAASADSSGSASLVGYTIVNMLGANSANFSSTNKLRFTVPVCKGWNGFDPRSDEYVDINDGTLSADFSKAIKILENADEYSINLLAAPGIQSSSVGSICDMVIDCCKNRGDAFALIDLADGTTTASGLNLTVAAAQSEAEKFDTNYAAAYYPWIRINDIDNDKLVWVPPSVEVLGVYSFNYRVAQPWYAPAGFTRGGLENVLEVRRRLTQKQRDDLQKKNVNPLATFPGSGIVVWGQQTLQKKSSLLDRVNVRRMLLTVRRTIAGFSRFFVFEPITVMMMSSLENRINEYLNTVKNANGLQEFRATLDETTTTPDLIDRNTVKGKIYLKPTSAAELILLDFSVTRTGAVFAE